MRFVTTALLIASISLVGCRPEDKPTTHKDTDEHGKMSSTKDMKSQMDEMNVVMVKKLGNNDPDYEMRFIDMMIPHHEGAVMMAKDALEHANKPELKQMAEQVIASQEKEIATLKEWRKEWYPEN